ncbi:DUF4286 family protein [Pedobacter sp. LMG 31464]|uniref:DUF4286 family protein n=1 Tax=Pedobacter planticolens TaxID=2679964 RepID=A0A923IXT2_9SPHI|nr:DUF4286 family protein [Pedobacter planticolens]MBB2146667.1 DUF4286 family protein [Pedobacter planticolens]
MLLYNVTVIIEDAAAEEWLQWMLEIHIPEVMATGKFVSNRLLKVLDSPNEGVTYCTQYVAETLEAYEDYQQNYAPTLQTDLQSKFENRFVAFRTLMEFVA